MTINNCQEFALLLNNSPELSTIAIFKVFLGLMGGLNRGCKCNKEKRLKTMSGSYETVLLKKKENEYFLNEIQNILKDNDEDSITFMNNEKELFSLELNQ
jgi:hypothetical protein